MVYTTEYASPLGPITLACDGEAIIGLWFNGQRYFGNILPEQTEKKEHPLFADAKRWLDVYFSGREPDFLPPLRYDSTPFRRLICEIMLTIPYGKTMTYGQIAAEAAKRLGAEKMSAQAVGGVGEHLGRRVVDIAFQLDDGLGRIGLAGQRRFAIAWHTVRLLSARARFVHPNANTSRAA